MNLHSKEDTKRTASPLTPALSPLMGEGESAVGFMVPMRVQSWRSRRRTDHADQPDGALGTASAGAPAPYHAEGQSDGALRTGAPYHV